MFKWLSRKLTNDYNEVPLLFVIFNLNKYIKNGAKNSCILNLHPVLRDDEYIKSTMNEVITYIRMNYDMEDLSK